MLYIPTVSAFGAEVRKKSVGLGNPGLLNIEDKGVQNLDVMLAELGVNG